MFISRLIKLKGELGAGLSVSGFNNKFKSML